MDNKKLPIEEFKKIGILDENNEYSSKIKENDLDRFLKGATLIAEFPKKIMRFKLNENNGEINLEKISHNKTIQLSDKLDSLENRIVAKGEVYNKNIAINGQIVNKGEGINELTAEPSFYLALKNDKSEVKTIWGNDLKEKSKDFNVGENVQINVVGLKKSNENLVENIFTVETLTDINKKDHNLLFEYNPKTKGIESYDPENFNITEVNSIKLKTEDIESLKNGKVVSLSDGTELAIKPSSYSNHKIVSNQKSLLLLTKTEDQKLTYTIEKDVQKFNGLSKKDFDKLNTDYVNSLSKMKSHLENQLDNGNKSKGIKESLNVVKNEMKLNTSSNSLNKKEQPKKLSTTESKMLKEDNKVKNQQKIASRFKFKR